MTDNASEPDEDTSTWTDIGDDEIAPFGDHSWMFSYPGGRYRVAASQAEQDWIKVQINGAVERWPVFVKAQCGDTFKLCGVAAETPALGLFGGHWFELFIMPDARIAYWGNQVLHRTDWAITGESPERTSDET